jgi:hypothetical protein
MSRLSAANAKQGSDLYLTETTVLEYASFADEFGPAEGLDPNKKFAGIACLMAPSKNLRTFNEKWEQLLIDEEIPKPFSMKDFVQYKEAFIEKRWHDSKERKRVLKLIFPLIRDADVIPVGASVLLEDYWNLPDYNRKALGLPYYVAFQEVTANMAFAFTSLAMSSAKSEEELYCSGVSMVYAKLKKFTGPGRELWNQIKEANMFGHWMSSYIPGAPIDHPPLQAADIWAYSLGRMGEHGRPIKEEAELAFNFFGELAFAAARKHGGRFFSLMDKQEMLDRQGENHP